MKRPKDPRHHGLKEPKKLIEVSQKVEMSELDSMKEEVDLAIINQKWNALADFHAKKGHSITRQPKIKAAGYYTKMELIYTYMYENTNYNEEMLAYEAAISKYEEDIITYNAYEEGRSRRSSDQSIQFQIERTERRLANLKATQAGQPIPFPEG